MVFDSVFMRSDDSLDYYREFIVVGHIVVCHIVVCHNGDGVT
jgi:hypothetical protein